MGLFSLSPSEGPRARAWSDRLNVYRLFSTWRVPASAEEVADVFLESGSLPRWWKTFRTIEIDHFGQWDGRGRTFRVVERSILPYTVRFQCHVKRVRYPESFSLAVHGDFQGRGSLQISEVGPFAVLNFDWFVRVERPLFRYLSPLFRRAMAYNHRWSMRHGEQGLAGELARRRAALPGHCPAGL